MDQKNIIIGVIVVLVLLVGGYFLFQAMNTEPVTQTTNQETLQNTNENTEENNNDGIEVEVMVPKTYEVVYTDSGFSPATVTLKAGDTVMFKNQSTQGMWVGSAMHPSHMVYSGTNLQQHCPDPENNDFDQCKSDATGTSWSFTFPKVGSWGYHNHTNAKHFGKVVVE